MSLRKKTHCLKASRAGMPYENNDEDASLNNPEPNSLFPKEPNTPQLRNIP